METLSLHKYGPIYTVKEHLQCRRVPLHLNVPYSVDVTSLYIKTEHRWVSIALYLPRLLLRIILYRVKLITAK